MTSETTFAPASASAPPFTPIRVVRAYLPLLAVAVGICLVAIGSFAGHQLTDGAASRNFHHVFYLFDVGREYNVATWYASMLWALVGLLAAVFFAHARRYRLSWLLFAAVAFVASVDEYLELHERLDVIGNAIMPYLPFTVGFSWVLVGAPLALIVSLLLLRLVLSLPRRVRWGIVVGGLLFAAGAIGVETVSGRHIQQNAWIPDLTYIGLTLVEEFLEMAGIALAAASLISLIERDRETGVMRFSPALRRA